MPTSSPQNPLSFWEVISLWMATPWEILRIWMAGGEYAEKRIPELIATMIAQYQDENAIVGVVSDWLRAHFVDENQTAATFWVAQAIRRRGGRFFVATAEALETLPAVADELRTHPDIQSGTPEERRAKFGAAISDRFRNSFEAANARLAHIPTALGGTVSDPSRPSVGQRLSSFFAGAATVAGRIAEVALVVTQYVIAALGLCGAYLIACVAIAWSHPVWMPTMDKFAWWSFYLLVGVPIAFMILGILAGRVGAVIQLASWSWLTILSSSLLVIAFTVASVNGIIVNNDAWDTVTMTLVVTVVWWIVWALVQKFLSTSAFFLHFLPRYLDDFKIDKADAEALAGYLKESGTFDKISVPVASAISGGMLLLTVLKLWMQPLPLIQATGLIGLEVLMSGAFIRMNIRLSNEHDYPSWLGLSPLIKKWMARLYQSSMTTAAVAALLIVLGVGLAGFIGKDRVEQWWTSGRDSTLSGVERTGEVISHSAQRLATAVDDNSTAAPQVEPVRTQPSESHASGAMMNCGADGMISATKVRKDLADLGEGFCSGGMGGYPCECHK